MGIEPRSFRLWVLNKFWTNFEQVLNKFLPSFEQVLNKLWTSFEQVLNKFWSGSWSEIMKIIKFGRFFMKICSQYFVTFSLVNNEPGPSPYSCLQKLHRLSLVIWESKRFIALTSAVRTNPTLSLKQKTNWISPLIQWHTYALLDGISAQKLLVK